jgi:predicted DNA-binding protein YlxM (UPF0122 family)
MQAPDISMSEIAGRYNVSRATLYNALARAKKKKDETTSPA